MITSIHHVQITVPVGAEAMAREFYCAVLGLKEVPKPESLAARGGFWLQVGDRQMHIGTEDNVDRSASKAHAAYLVNDLEECRMRLGAHGVKITDGIPIPGYSRFEFRDPFGNRVEFLQKLDERHS